LQRQPLKFITILPSKTETVVGLQVNNSIQTIDLSDNDFLDQHGQLLCSWLKAKSETRDQELWALSLRQR
jgi:hypothetical protein